MTGLYAEKTMGRGKPPARIDGRTVGRHETLRTPKGTVLHRLVAAGRVLVEASSPEDIVLWGENLGIRLRPA